MTVLLLDVDGVINATRPAWGTAPRTGTANAVDSSWRIRWAPELIIRLHRLVTAGADARWCSTWCGQADDLEALLGLSLPSAFGQTSDVPRAKLDAALSVVAAGEPLIWADDELPDNPPDALNSPRVLLIKPNPRRGLAPHHIEEMERFHTTIGTA